MAERVSGWVWGAPMLVLIVTIGVLLMVRLRCLPLRRVGQGLRLALRDTEGQGGAVIV